MEKSFEYYMISGCCSHSLASFSCFYLWFFESETRFAFFSNIGFNFGTKISIKFWIIKMEKGFWTRGKTNKI